MSRGASPRVSESDFNGAAIPSIYEASYKRTAATCENPKLALQYVRHTTVADPPADRAVASLYRLQPREINRVIRAGLDLDEAALKEAPDAVRNFFEEVGSSPVWWNPDTTEGGCGAFDKFSDLLVGAFFFATVMNASTLIAKAFYATGRVNSTFGPRRIRQNTRHLIDIMLPRALYGRGGGWRLSVRIRLVHAQIRRLIRAEGDWDEATFGVPISSAHMALASANFSAAALRLARSMGAKIDPDSGAEYMQLWRYASWLIGTPDELLFEGDEADTLAFSSIAHACEPPAGRESAVIAQALVEALPGIGGVRAPKDEGAIIQNAYRIGRALLGSEMADQLGFPRLNATGLMSLIRSKSRTRGSTRRFAPTVAEAWRGASFAFLLDAAALDDPGYGIPDRLRAEDATPW